MTTSTPNVAQPEAMQQDDTRPTPSIDELVSRSIGRLQHQYTVSDRPTSWAAATMAALRIATPGRLDESPASWEVVYSSLPETLVGVDDVVSRAERAVHASLVLYAVHQTSQPSPMHQPGVRLGKALRRLPGAADDKSPILRRFTSLVAASTFDATTYHLRGLITLLRRERLAVDHVRLCRDLRSLQDPRLAPAVRRQWGRDFFGGRGLDAPALTDTSSTAD